MTHEAQQAIEKILTDLRWRGPEHGRPLRYVMLSREHAIALVLALDCHVPKEDREP